MGKFRVEIKRSAVREIKKLPVQSLKKILMRIKSLSDDSRPFGCQKISGQEKYRIRCGVYRILYSIEDDILVIYVVKVGHRKSVYENKK